MIVFKKEDNNVGSIKSLWVDPKYRGKGLGRKLIQEILNLAKDNKIKEIELGVNTKSEPAINLYKSFGFEVIKTIENKKMADGKIESLFKMYLEL